jgi:transposase-like protein
MTRHLDEVYLKIDGRLVYLWRAVDAEGEVLDVLVQTRRNRQAALKLMRKLLRNMALSQTSSSQMICDLTVQRRGILGSQNAMNAVDGATIERRIRINRPDDENTRCKVSRRRWPDRRQERRLGGCWVIW